MRPWGMHRTLFVLALGACSFHAAPPLGGPPSDNPDAPTGGAPDDASLEVASCHTQDPNVRLCIDFEQPALTPIAYDGSPLAQKNNVTTQGIRAMDRLTEQAAQLDTNSTLTIAETPSLDITGDLTIELWANPQVLPPTDRYWMFDNNTQYGMELMMDGTVRCDIGNMVVDHPTTISAGTWVHVACVYGSGRLSVYVDGSSTQACRNVPPPPAGGMDGSAIGGNISAGPTVMQKFVGGIDNVAIYAEALSPGTICQLAGHNNCGPYICATGP